MAKDPFGVAAEAIIEQFIYAKMPPHLKKSINQSHLENGTYEQIVSHLERKLEMNGLEAPDEMPITTVTQQVPQQNSEKRNPTTQTTKRPNPKIIRIVPTMTMVVPNQTLTPTTKFQTISKRTIQIIRKTEDLDLSSQPVSPVVELTTPQGNVTLEQTQRTDRLPGIDGWKEKTKSGKEMHIATPMGMSKLQPKL